MRGLAELLILPSACVCDRLAFHHKMAVMLQWSERESPETAGGGGGAVLSTCGLGPGSGSACFTGPQGRLGNVGWGGARSDGTPLLSHALQIRQRGDRAGYC